MCVARIYLAQSATQRLGANVMEQTMPAQGAAACGIRDQRRLQSAPHVAAVRATSARAVGGAASHAQLHAAGGGSVCASPQPLIHRTSTSYIYNIYRYCYLLLSMSLPNSSLVSLTQGIYTMLCMYILVISYYTCCENEV